MSDVYDTVKRSEVMSRIRGRDNKSTEMKLAAAFRQCGVIGWRRQVPLKPRLAEEDQEPSMPSRRISVRPDFIFRANKVAVFVDGCFWHGCPQHAKMPVAIASFWTKKLTGNMRRDQRATRALQAAGWTVVRIWEHELTNPTVVTQRVLGYLSNKNQSPRAS